MKSFVVLITLAAGFCLIQQSSGQASNPSGTKSPNMTWTEMIKRDIFASYDKYARPSEHNNTTEVVLKMNLVHLDIDERKSVMNVNGWLHMKWFDAKLQWNASEYGNLDTIHIGEHEFWQPDIMLYNSATGNNIDHFGNTNAILKSTGELLWVPPCRFAVLCQFDLRYWPFDKQMCSLVFGSWTYNSYQIDLVENGPDSINNDHYITENSEWKITELATQRNVKVYSCCEEPYVDVSFNISVVRRTPMHKAVIITPASVIVLMTLANFWLPAQSGEKILLNGVNALIICMMLLYFAQHLPVMALHTPLVVLFYSSSFYMVCFSMIMSVIVMNLSRNRHANAVPWAIKKMLDGCIGSALGLKSIVFHPPPQNRAEELRDQPFDEHTTSEDHQIIQTASKSPMQQDWIVLATAIDRIMFLIYCFVFIVLAVAYSI